MAAGLSHDGPLEARYVIRPDAAGFSIRDLWTGQPATLAGAPQVGLSARDAEHTAALLNQASTNTQPAPAQA